MMAEEFTEQNGQTETKKTKLTKLQKWFRTLRRLYRCASLCLLPYKKYGCTQKFNDRSYIIVSNHLSVLDVIPPVLVTDKAIHFMAKKELFVKGAGKWFTKKCECIPVSRDGSDVRAVMQAMKYLKSGSVVCIFPEGTRNKTEDRFLPLKSGAAALAIKTKTPIIPIVQVKKIKLFRKIRFYCGEPFELAEFYGAKLSEEDVKKADELLLQKMNELYSELENQISDKKKK